MFLLRVIGWLSLGALLALCGAIYFLRAPEHADMIAHDNQNHNHHDNARAVRCECVRGRDASIASALKSYHKECSDWDKYPKACEKKEFNLWHDLIFLEGLLHAQLDRLDAPGYEGSRDEIRARNERALRRVRYELDCGIGAGPDCAEHEAALLKETYSPDATGLSRPPTESRE